MAKTSLNAYAAWLAKHESKAPKRRSLDAVETTVETISKASTSNESTSTDPYLKWIQRKETKLPAVKVVMVTPESIEEIVERGRAAVAAEQAKKIGFGQHFVPERRSLAHSKMEPVKKQGKKRTAASVVENEDRVDKKAKTTTTTTKPSVAKCSSSTTLIVQDDDCMTEKKMEKKKVVLPTRCSTRTQLPMISEVQYWRDVDRFSFLA